MADEQVSGTGATGAAGGGNGSGQAGSGQNSSTGGQGAAGSQAGGTGSGQAATEKVFTYKEDRTDWRPAHRFNEVTNRATKAEQEVARLKQELDTREGRIRALAGVDTPDPKQKEAEELRSLIYELVPEISALQGLTKDQLQEVLDAAQTARQATSAGWNRHRDGVVTQMNDEAAKVMGVDKLTETQASRLLVAFRAEAQNCVEERKAAMRRGERESLQTSHQDSDFVSRYEAGDKSLIQQFVKAYLDDWYTPARRSVESRISQRNRPVPSGTRIRQQPVAGEPKQDLNTEDGFKAALIAARTAGERS